MTSEESLQQQQRPDSATPTTPSTPSASTSNVNQNQTTTQSTMIHNSNTSQSIRHHPPAPAVDGPSDSPPIPPLPSSSHSHMILAGLVSGISVAGLFNPWDRALYLSVLHSRPFLSRANFVQPYQGFLQVLFHRTLTGGLYFPLFDMAQPIVHDVIGAWVASQPKEQMATAAEQSALLHFACGNFAGGVSGIVLNSLTAIKYASWDARTGFFSTARNMYRAGGIRPFTKGISATVLRDTCFGGIFAWTKFELARWLQPFIRREQIGPISRTTAVHIRSHPAASTTIPSPTTVATTTPTPTTTTTSASVVTPVHLSSNFSGVHYPPSLQQQFIATTNSQHQFFTHLQFSASTIDFTAALLAGLTATGVSSPFNYVRNIKYGWPSDSVPPSTPRILLDLGREAHSSNRPLGFLQERLRLGWGTARVAVGMAVGQYLYEVTKVKLDKHAEVGREHTATRM